MQNVPCVWYQVKIKQAGKTSKPTPCMCVCAHVCVLCALVFRYVLHGAADHFPYGFNKDELIQTNGRFIKDEYSSVSIYMA